MQQHTSANTSINKNKVPQLFTTVSKHIGWAERTVNFDIGGGKFDTASNYLLHKKYVFNCIYDPYNRSDEENAKTLAYMIEYGADTATLSNVLNVIDSVEAIEEALNLAYRALNKYGICYITCYKSKKKGKSKKDCWQRGKPLDWYMPYVEKVFGNVTKKHGMLIAVKK